MRKKVAAVALAMVLCAGLAGQNVHAESCPPHKWNITGIAGQYKSGSGHHKVYRNLYVGDEQAYSYCTITYTTTIYNVYCSTCQERGTEDVITESHSLANDPDHAKSK